MNSDLLKTLTRLADAVGCARPGSGSQRRCEAEAYYYGVMFGLELCRDQAALVAHKMRVTRAPADGR
jgi:hypothetical protein